jgi:hypothetical protein
MAVGSCEMLNNCKYSHAPFESEGQMANFFEANEQYLIDIYRKKGGLTNYDDQFINFLQKKIDKNPNYMDNRGGPLPMPMHMRFINSFPKFNPDNNGGMPQLNQSDLRPTMNGIGPPDMNNNYQGIQRLLNNTDPFQPIFISNNGMGPKNFPQMPMNLGPMPGNPNIHQQNSNMPPKVNINVNNVPNINGMINPHQMPGL